MEPKPGRGHHVNDVTCIGADVVHYMVALAPGRGQQKESSDQLKMDLKVVGQKSEPHERGMITATKGG